MKKQSVVTSIIIVLVLFTALMFFRGSEIGPPKDPIIYDEAGTYSDQAFYKNGEIRSSDVTIEDAVFSQTLTISKEIAKGDIYLNRLEVAEELIINGASTIYINGGTYKKITANAENVEVILLGDAQIDDLKAEKASTIVVNDQSFIKNLVIEKGAKKSSITTQSSGIIKAMQIKATTDLILNSPSDSIIFGAESTGSTFVNYAKVKKLQVEAKISLTIAADVDTLIVTASGEATVIKLENNAIINNLALEKPVTVTGDGTIINATVPDISYLKGSIVPKNLSISAKPLIPDPNGGLMVTTIIARPVDSDSIVSLVSRSRSDEWSSAINDHYEAPAVSPPSPPSDQPLPPPIPTPVPIPTPEPKPILVKSIHLSASELTLVRGESKVISAKVLPEDASNKEIIWKTANPKVAIVSNGIITPKGNGVTTISATTIEGNHSASCKVTVKTNITAVIRINDEKAQNNGIAKDLDYGSDYSLPDDVVVQGYSDESFTCPVSWTPAKADTKKTGETLYKGSLKLPSNYLNPKNIEAKITLTIGDKPVISADPPLVSQRLYLEGNPAPLSVNATVTEGKSLSYEWFYKVDGSENLVPISSASSANYSPPVSTTPGIIYYYCKVSADQADSVTELCGIIQTGKELANPADLSEVPTINKEPVSQNIPKTQANFKVSVDAEVEKGTLSYQWFKSKSPLSVKGTAIEGGTTASISINSSELSTFNYYYVEITNKEENHSAMTRVSQVATIIFQ